MKFTKGQSGNPHGRAKGVSLVRTKLKKLVQQADAGIDEAGLVQSIQTAAAHDWRAASWLLERLNPRKWGQNPQGLAVFTSGDNIDTLIQEAVNEAIEIHRQ